MPILADTHMHSSFSADSDTPMEEQIRAAVRKGLKLICFTEHLDLDTPYLNDPPGDRLRFDFDYERYHRKFLELQEQYGGIDLRFGVELGLASSLKEELASYVSSHPGYDCIIGSTHSVRRMDPYYDSYFAGRSAGEAFREYFAQSLENVRTCIDLFDSYGHLDYVLRYGPQCADGSTPERTAGFYYRGNADLIDPLLQLLIDHGKALEVNTQAYKKGFPETNPGKAVLARYYELGGRLITIGADAHTPDGVGFGFDRAAALLKQIGFREYLTFRRRKPEPHAL